MKFILAFCCCICAVHASTQITGPTLDLLTRGMTALQQGKFEETILLTEKALPAVKKEIGESDPIYIGLFFMMGYSHYNLYHYELAEKNYLVQKELLGKTSGEKDKNYAACLSRLAILYRDMGKYRQGIALFEQVLNILLLLNGQRDEDYAKNLNNLALLYGDVGDYAKAGQLYNQSAEISRRLTGDKSADYASTLNNIGTLYSTTGQFERADSLFRQVMEIRKQLFGENSTEYAESLNNLATLCINMGRYSEAESPYVRASAIFKKLLGENSPNYAISLNNLAQYYETVGRYEQSEKLYNEAISIRKKVLGEGHPDYATSLSNLAGLYLNAGKFEKAESLFVRARSIELVALGNSHPSYSTALNNLAGLYESMGQYKKAEPLYIEALAIKKKVLGQEHPSYAVGLNNLAYLYYNIGQYEKTEPLFKQALDVTKASMGEYNADYATSLNNLANVWQTMKQYQKAETAFLKVLDIYRNIFGEMHANYALALNNLATLYSEQKFFQKAEPLLIQAGETWKKSVGESSPVYATALNNLASFYRKTQVYEKAERLYTEVVALRKKILGDHHPHFAESQNDMGLLYMQMGQYEKAIPLFLSSSEITLQNIPGTFSILSEKEKGKFLGYNRQLTECNNSFLYCYKNAPGIVAENNYNLELGLKSLSLADTRSMFETIRASNDSALKKMFAGWSAAKTLLAKEYSKPASGRSPDLAKTEAVAEELEKELNRKSSSFSAQQKSLRVTMKDVQQNLDEDEAAVEFIRFKLYRNNWTDSVIYGAFVLRKQDAAPHFVPLCEKKQLQLLFDSAGNTAAKLVKSFYRGLDAKTKEVRLGSKLYNLIWAPLEPYLQGVKKIAYSPAGKLYSVAFHVLPVDSNTILMDKYKLQQYTSTRQVAFRNPGNTDARPKSIALFGGPQFTMDSVELVQQRKIKAALPANLVARAKTRSGAGGVWVDLPGTAEEVKKIGDLFAKNNMERSFYTGTEASEENFKKLSNNSPRVLHIATHGYFLPDLKKKDDSPDLTSNAYSIADDPLLRNGLVLAGGNYTWGGKQPIDGVEDGILTAYEIAQQNLSNTELLVLSACETALGDVKGTEGVFGLQRAFKIAGVKKMIVSLWQVPDKETSELMNMFYVSWMNGKTIRDAFYEAQSAMRQKYPAYYWAAFVLIE